MIWFMTVKDRLKAAMAAKGLKKAEFARRCEVSAPTVTYWLNGATETLKGHNLLKAASVLGVSPQWLETGRGEMSAPTHLTPEQSEILTVINELNDQNQNALLLMARSLRASQPNTAPSAAHPFVKNPTQ